MPAITINGQQVEVHEGISIMEAAQSGGIYIPGLCAHPDLPAAGVCGLCLVEVEGENAPVKACSTPVKPGMIVRTETERVQALRREALKKILATHPHACLTCAQREGCSRTQCSSNVPENERCCPKLGNCEVQKVTEYIGMPEGVPRYVYRGLPVLENEPLFRYDYNLCIACTRCVRACQDLRGVGAMAVVFRGAERFVGFTGPTPPAAGCRFCGACVEVCPTGALMDKDAGVGPREEFLVPCRNTCPAGIDVPRYVRLIAQGRIAEALAVVRERVPFPAVLGYACRHPCEAVCRRGEVNEAVAIQALKRAAAEHGGNGVDLPAPKPPTGKKVAVVGAGPAGLTCAYYLAQKGHAVTIYEALPEPGGMMRYGIPAHRLPREVLANEVMTILARGVELKVGVAVGRDISLEELASKYDAVLLAPGAAASRRRAIGQAADQKLLAGTVKTTPQGTIEVNASLETSQGGVFAAGDAVSGRATVIKAIAGGRRAAASIDRYLGGDGDIDEVLVPAEEPSPRLGREDGFASLARVKMPCLGAEARKNGFAPVEQGYGVEQARAEARRCLQCDLRLKIGAPWLPPISMPEFNAANVAQVPAVEGVYQFLDEGGQVLLIAGTANLRQALNEQLANAPDDPVLGRARYFLYEEDPMYTKRESELIQKYLQEHGRLPEGNDVLDDLF